MEDNDQPKRKKHPLEVLLDHLVGRHGGPDTSNWQQVAKFGPEQILKQRLFGADTDRRKNQAEVLGAKIEALQAEQVAAHKEFWEFLYETLSVPRDGNYHITGDGRLLKEPKEATK